MGGNRHQTRYPCRPRPSSPWVRRFSCHLHLIRRHSLEGMLVGIAREGRQDRGPRDMMTMTPCTEHASDSDAKLWQLVLQGSASAFEVLVGRHQSLVSAVAYSACGNLALSEDVAQETFWTAWRQRGSLEQPGHLASWLCGIPESREERPAQGVARGGIRRRAGRRDGDTRGRAEPRGSRGVPGGGDARLGGAGANPRVLSGAADPLLPPGPVGGRSRRALELSEDAVKQRLSRGRGMLREQVADLVEGGLRRSRPAVSSA